MTAHGRQRAEHRESLLLGYGLVALLALGLGWIGRMDERRSVGGPGLPASPRRDERAAPAVVSDADASGAALIDKEEWLVWGVSYLGFALLGPLILLLLVLCQIRQPVVALAAVPALFAGGGIISYSVIRRWNALSGDRGRPRSGDGQRS